MLPSHISGIKSSGEVTAMTFVTEDLMDEAITETETGKGAISTSLASKMENMDQILHMNHPELPPFL